MSINFVAFDLETTGFLPGVDQVVEVGAVKFIQGQPSAVFSTLVNPGRSIPASSTRITGISDEMVDGKPSIDRLLEPFTEFVADLPLVAHNAPFDFQFILEDYKKYEIPAPHGVVLDTCSISRKVFPGLINYKLGTLVQHLKISSTKFHRAEEDANYCGQLFVKITERVFPNGQTINLENLINLTGKEPLRFPKIEKKPKQLELL